MPEFLQLFSFYYTSNYNFKIGREQLSRKSRKFKNLISAFSKKQIAYNLRDTHTHTYTGFLGRFHFQNYSKWKNVLSKKEDNK